MSWIEDHLPDGIKDALCEPDTPAAKPVQQPPPVLPVAAITSLISQISPTESGTSSVASAAVAAILADLRSKTNFSTTPTGKALAECEEALADTGMSAEMKSKTAMKLTHQSPVQVVAALQVLQTALTADKAQFESSMQKASAEVDARQAKSAQLRVAIEDAERGLETLRQNKAQIDTEVQDKQNRISSARANYAAASEARNTELAEMISHYQNIPEVK